MYLPNLYAYIGTNIKQHNQTRTVNNMTRFADSPYALPADVKLNEKEEIVLRSLLISASGQGYDFGYADFDEATQEAIDAMPKGARSYRAYLGSLSKKGLIDVLETETNDDGQRYTQFYVTMPEADEDDAADEPKAVTPIEDRDITHVWTAAQLMNFKVFYSKRRLEYIIKVTEHDVAYVKGNKADFFAYLEQLDPKTELPHVIVEDDRILVG